MASITFWTRIEPFVGPGLRYLELTSSGKRWIANLYSHVFTVEHNRRGLGPHVPETPAVAVTEANKTALES